MRRLAILVLILLPAVAGCEVIEPVVNFPEEVINQFKGANAVRAATWMENQENPDLRRQGINDLVKRDYGKHPPYTLRYAQIARDDPDYTVRAYAIRALNRSRDKTAIPTYIAALGDSSEMVELEACKALNNIPDASAVDPLITILNDTNKNRDVRLAAAEALRHYRNLSVARALIATLDGREFGVAWQSRQSLVQITSRDFYYSPTEWLKYLTGPEKPFG